MKIIFSLIIFTILLFGDIVDYKNYKNLRFGNHCPDYIMTDYLKKILNDEEISNDFVVLDVREKEEVEREPFLNDSIDFETNYINIPRGMLEMKINKQEIIKNKKIVIVCKSGERADWSWLTLTEMGYKNLVVLKRGINGWNNIQEIPTKFFKPINCIK